MPFVLPAVFLKLLVVLKYIQQTDRLQYLKVLLWVFFKYFSVDFYLFIFYAIKKFHKNYQ